MAARETRLSEGAALGRAQDAAGRMGKLPLFKLAMVGVCVRAKAPAVRLVLGDADGGSPSRAVSHDSGGGVGMPDRRRVTVVPGCTWNARQRVWQKPCAKPGCLGLVQYRWPNVVKQLQFCSPRCAARVKLVRTREGYITSGAHGSRVRRANRARAIAGRLRPLLPASMEALPFLEATRIELVLVRAYRQGWQDALKLLANQRARRKAVAA